MGTLSAMDMAAHAPQGLALEWHLRSNHFPPLPLDLIPVAQAAIEAGQDEDWDRLLDMPEGISFRDRTDGKVRAGDAIESMHLDAFLLVDEGDDDG